MSVVRTYYSQLLPKDISYFAAHVDEIHLHVVVHFVSVKLNILGNVQSFL